MRPTSRASSVDPDGLTFTLGASAGQRPADRTTAMPWPEDAAARALAVTAAADHLPYPSPQQRAWLRPLLAGLARWHRATADGLDELRRAGPCLLVAKHPRTWLYTETMLLARFTFLDDASWPEIQVMEKRGTSLHRAPLIGWLRRNVNTIPAEEEAAVATLQAGRSVLTFPGGARELHGEADRLQWGGHRAFARIAARAGVPVVPLAIQGADRQHPWRVRVGRRNTLWLPPLPLPVRLVYRFGRAMPAPTSTEDRGLREFADAVEAATQALLLQRSRVARSMTTGR
jgi:1-acyl-sn-glycerol-3-phosphate acyltransferase